MKNGLAAPIDTPLHMPICGILGVAILGGVSFDHALAVFEEIRMERNPRARRLGKGWKGYTFVTEQQEALHRLGCTMGRFDLGDRTLRHWCLTADPDWPFMVHVNKHIMTTFGRMVYDQVAPKGKDVEEHNKRRCKVQTVWYVKSR